MPATREEFWKTKIEGNRRRDIQAAAALLEADWRVLVVWECALRGPGRLPIEELLDRSADFVKASSYRSVDISGRFSAKMKCR